MTFPVARAGHYDYSGTGDAAGRIAALIDAGASWRRWRFGDLETALVPSSRRPLAS